MLLFNDVRIVRSRPPRPEAILDALGKTNAEVARKVTAFIDLIRRGGEPQRPPVT